MAEPVSNATNSSMDILAVRLDALHGDVGEIKTALGRLSDAITKLALVEQQQNQTALALERAFKALDKLESRVSVLENKSPTSERTVRWVDQAVLGAIVLVLLFVAKKVGLV